MLHSYPFPSLYLQLGPGALSGHLFAELCDQLLISEASDLGIQFHAYSDRSGDYNGLDSFAVGKRNFEGFSGKVGFQYKFLASESGRLSRSQKQSVQKSLAKAKADNPDLSAWILITPEDFNNHQLSWLHQMRDETGCAFPIVHWGQKRLTNLMLRHPVHARYFYPQLTPGTSGIDLRQLCRATLERLRTRYSPEFHYLHLVLEDGREVDAALEKFLNDEGTVFFSLLGSYGSGKSTILERFTIRLCHAFLDGSSRRAPLFIPLRYVRGTAAFRYNALSYLNQEYGFSADFSTLQHMLAEGLLVAIFDGLDEKETTVRDHNVIRIREVLEFMTPRSKLLLSSRTEYFADAVEEARFLDDPAERAIFRREHEHRADEIRVEDGGHLGVATQKAELHYLQPINPGELDAYLKARFGAKAEVQRSRIDRIYDLQDLVKRPVLLDLTCQALPRLSETQRITASALYTAFVRDQIENDILVDRIVASFEEKIVNIEAVAVQMLCTSRYNIHSNEIWGKVPLPTGESIRDARNTSLMIRDSGGFCEFSHRSFLEYFGASAALRALTSRSGLSEIWKIRARWSDQMTVFFDELAEIELETRVPVPDLDILRDPRAFRPITTAQFAQFRENVGYDATRSQVEVAGYAAVTRHEALAYAVWSGLVLPAAEELAAAIHAVWPHATWSVEKIHAMSFFDARNQVSPDRVLEGATGLVVLSNELEWCRNRHISLGHAWRVGQRLEPMILPIYHQDSRAPRQGFARCLRPP